MAETRPRIPINELLDFLVSQPTPQQIINLKASDEAQLRLRYLLDGNRNEVLSDTERAELETYIHLDNLVSMLKIRARDKLMEKA